VNKSLLFWVGPLALSGVLIGPTETTAQTTAKPSTSTTKPAASSAKASTRYSAARARNRRAALARARAAAYAREAAEDLPRLKPDAEGVLVPDVRAAAAIVYDPETHEVLWEENSQAQRSIASITKVMTATVFLETNPDLSEVVTVNRADVTRASTTFLRAGDKMTVDDLLHLLLIASDNAASRTLARVSPYGTEGFINRMNETASELGLTSTHYEDTSGLLSDNVSSALDMARLITHASTDERIASVMRTPEYTIRTQSARPRTITFRSTNHLLGRQDVDVRAGKTGFISKSGYCLATLLRLPQTGREIAVVVLGARSNAGRFVETRNLFDWLSIKSSTLFGVASSATLPAAAPQAQVQ